MSSNSRNSSTLSTNKVRVKNENYFSIDDILATQAKIPCKFEVTVYNLGYLDPSCDADDLQAGTKLELAYWLACTLCGRNKHTVSVQLPKQYREGYRQVFSADATVVDLHQLGPYFYAFGMRMLHFDLPDSADVAKSLIQTFQGRFRNIMDASQNTLNEDTSRFTEKLDETERAMFAVGQAGLNEFDRWERREMEKLTMSTLVITHHKRKRVEMDDD